MRYATYQIYKWIVIFPLVGVITCVSAVLAVSLSKIYGDVVASRISGRIWSRSLLKLVPATVNVDGNHRINPTQSYVVVSNHQSIVDVVLLYGWLQLDFKWVMKKELRNIPALGWACEALGHIFIDRSNAESAQSSLDSAKLKIKNGISVVFFPEGTRSANGDLLPFKNGAFKFAKSLDLPILPVSLCDTSKISPANSLDVHPGTIRMVIHEPIEVNSKISVEAIKSLAKSRILSGLG